ncbi:MAG: DNA-binding beta-propeller fold protein YncE, partial [Polyangiales bacterium]
MSAPRYCLLLGALLSLACGDDSTPDAATHAADVASHDAAEDIFDGGPPAFGLRAPEGANVGEAVYFEVVGAEAPFDWQVGSETFRSEGPRIERSFEARGRYPIRVTLTDGREDSALLVVTDPPTFESSHSSTVSVGPEHVAVVVPDTGSLVLARFDAGLLTESERVRPCDDPVAVTLWMADDEERFVVACDGDARVALVHDGEVEVLDLPAGSRPRGVAIDGGRAFVTLQGIGAIAELTGEGGLSLVEVHAAVRDVRAIAALPRGGVVAARFRSADDAGELFWMDGASRTVSLRFDPQPSADTESGGVPTLLGGLVASPDASHLVVVGQQANIGEGTFVSDRPLTFETSIRAGLRVVSADGEEAWEERFLFDNRGLATAAVFSPRGDTLFVLDQAHRSIERLDRLNGEVLGSLLDVGFGATGLAISRDGRTLFVNAETSRELRAYSVRAMGPTPPQARLTLVSDEPLAEDVLRGRVLFEDSFDPRLARDGYIACASCHPGGDSDHRVWDFTDRGEGLRRTPALFGRTLDGPLHWSA